MFIAYLVHIISFGLIDFTIDQIEFVCLFFESLLISVPNIYFKNKTAANTKEFIFILLKFKTLFSTLCNEILTMRNLRTTEP